MPSATDTTARPLAQMKPTPGVTPETEAPFAEPMLRDDIDVVKLARLYPEEFKAGYEGARAAALAAGRAAFEAAPHVVASQQEPVSGQEGMAPPAQSPGVAPPARPPAAAAPTPPPPPPGTQWTPQQIAAWQAQQAARPPGA
jgi:hypothetical protein